MTALPPFVVNATSGYSHAAYTPVTLRRTLTTPNDPIPQVNPPPPVNSMSSTTTKKKIDWPPEVRQYVQRCFVPEAMVPGVSRQEMETRLKRIITEATESGNLETLKWTQLPLPQEMIRDERKNNILASQVTPFVNSVPGPTMGALPSEPAPIFTTSPGHKRKSSELAKDTNGSVTIPPWRSATAKLSFEDRLSAPKPAEKRQKKEDHRTIASKSDLENRKRRFGSTPNGPSNGSPREASPSKIESSGPVVGRSQNLEKNYFRLTAPPNPDTVRPLPILKQTLDLLKKKWRKENNYTYICDQFKSLRQDLTVQHIKNEFTVNVYEIHARIALEKGDLGEYNQCQTQLRALYKQNLGGHPMEFMAYRILYFIYTCNRSDMNDVLADLTPTDKADSAVKHALDVRSALALGNYHRFFQLYLSTPNMGAYLMDMFVARERLRAIAAICKSYKPDVKIRFITEELGFESDEESARFLLDYAPAELLQEREDGVKLLTGKAGAVFETAKSIAFKVVDIKGQI